MTVAADDDDDDDDDDVIVVVVVVVAIIVVVIVVSFESLCDIGERHGEGLNGRERVLKVQSVGVRVDSTELHHLPILEFDLEILSRLLRHATSEIELVHLTGFVPERRFIMHNEFPSLLQSMVLARAAGNEESSAPSSAHQARRHSRSSREKRRRRRTVGMTAMVVKVGARGDEVVTILTFEASTGVVLGGAAIGRNGVGWRWRSRTKTLSTTTRFVMTSSSSATRLSTLRGAGITPSVGFQIVP